MPASDKETSMTTFTYRLIPGGYQILSDGRLYINQPFAPGEPGERSLSPEEAEILATELVAELESRA